MPKFCRQCGSPVNEGAKFCRSCGAAVSQRTSAPAYNAPPRTRAAAQPRTASSRVGAPVKEPKKKGYGGRIVAAVLVAALLFTGFGWPGWFRGHKSDGPDYRMDGDLMELTVNVDPATELVYQAGMSSVQSYVNARLALEKLTRAAERGVGGAELEALADETAEAWRVASGIAAKTEVMASALERSGRANGPTLEAVFDALSLSTGAYAAEPTPEMLEWAKKVTEMYDAAPAGRKVRTLADNLGLDAKSAFNVIQQTQEIMKGHYDQVAASADTWYKACMITKTACKVVAVGAAVVSTGGAAGGMVGLTDAVLLTGSAVDCVVEVGDTTANIVCGEDSQAAADYAVVKNTLAPITGTIGAAGVFVGSWGTATDKAGQMIYLSDSLNDLAQNGKILGVELPGGMADAAKAVGEKVYKMVPVGSAPDAPSKMTVDEVKQTLEKLGISPAAAEKLAEAVDQPPRDEPEDAGYRTLEDLPDETLDEMLDDMLSSEDMEQSFDELIDRYLEEMDGAVTEDDFRGLEEDEDGHDFDLPDDPEQWQGLIDELFPTDDLIVQEGDDEGFDNPENWVRPENPGEDWGDDNSNSSVEEDEVEPEEPVDSELPEGVEIDDSDPIYQVIGTYVGTETEYSYYPDMEDDIIIDDTYYAIRYDGETLYFVNHYYLTHSSLNRRAIPINFNSLDMTGTAYLNDPDQGPEEFGFRFGIENGQMKLTMTYTNYWGDEGDYTVDTFEGVKVSESSEYMPPEATQDKPYWNRR